MSKSEIGTRPHASMFKRGFTVVDNEIFDNFEISPSARLLLMYLIRYATCPNYVAYNGTKEKWIGCKRKKLQELHRELILAGYMRLNTGGKGGGSYYEFHSEPIFRKASAKTPQNSERSKKGLPQKGTVPKTTPLIRTDLLSNTNFKTKLASGEKKRAEELLKALREGAEKKEALMAPKEKVNDQPAPQPSSTSSLTSRLLKAGIQESKVASIIQNYPETQIEQALTKLATKQGVRSPEAMFMFLVKEPVEVSMLEQERVSRATREAVEELKRKEEWEAREKSKEALQSNPERVGSIMGALRDALKQGMRESMTTC